MRNLRINWLSLTNYGVNLSIRGVTILAKFAFTFFLGKQYPSSFLGEYGIFSTTILLCYFILTLSFDSFALREIISKPHDSRLSYVRNLFVFYFITFLIFIPAVGVIFYLDIIKIEYLLFFVGLLFLETMAQTFFALYTILQKSIISNLILFFTQGAWIIFVFAAWFIDPSNIQGVEDILVIWMFGSLVANLFAYYNLRRMFRTGVDAIDWKWIRSGISVSLLFFLATLSYKFIEFTDRYIIELKLGTAELGIYVFFSQIANLINTVINVVVILVLYPRLIENFMQGDINAFVTIKNKMYLRVVLIGVSIAVGEVVLIHYLLKLLGKEAFNVQVKTFYILLLANIVMNLSFIPHYCLYAFKKDVVLLATTISGAAVNLLLNILLIPLYGITGAAFAAFLSFGSVWLMKALYVRNFLKQVRPQHSA